MQVRNAGSTQLHGCVITVAADRCCRCLVSVHKLLRRTEDAAGPLSRGLITCISHQHSAEIARLELVQ